MREERYDCSVLGIVINGEKVEVIVALAWEFKREWNMRGLKSEGMEGV